MPNFRFISSKHSYTVRDNETSKMVFHVIRDIQHDVILGLDFFYACNVELNFKKNAISVHMHQQVNDTVLPTEVDLSHTELKENKTTTKKNSVKNGSKQVYRNIF